MAKNLLSINASKTGITSKKKFSQITRKQTVLYGNQKNSKTSYFWSILNVFIYHHQLIYVHPVLFLLSIFKGDSIDTILHDFISVDIHCESKLLSCWIHTVFYVLLPFCFLYFFLSYYCLHYCCPIIIYLLLLLFTDLFTYLFIHIISSIELFCGLNLYI